MSLGTNDFLENYYTFPTRRSQFTIRQYQDFLVELAEQFIKELYSLGARKLSLTGVPPMGCLPLERATNIMNRNECVDEYNKVALEFNGKLQNLAVKLNRQLPGVNIFFADAFGVFNQILTKPSSFGKLFHLSVLTMLFDFRHVHKYCNK